MAPIINSVTFTNYLNQDFLIEVDANLVVTTYCDDNQLERYTADTLAEVKVRIQKELAFYL